MLIDSHCHLDHSPFALPELLTAAKAADVGCLLTVCVNLAGFAQNLQIARENKNIYTTVGVQPNEHDDHEATVDELVQLASDPLVVGIGEAGLDNYHHDVAAEVQVERFRNHIRAAKQINKPLIVHTRAAKIETIKILKDEVADEVGGVIHCFSEDFSAAKQFLDMGFYISFSGIITYPAADDLRAVAKQIPLDRILIETDSPYLTPQKMRGKPNQPAYVKYVAERLAEIKNLPLTTVAEQTTANFLRIFKLVGPLGLEPRTNGL
jgi:TatD DNase family protein